MLKVNVLCNSNKCEEPIYGEKIPVNALKLIIRATLLSQLSVEHSKVIEDFYECALRMEDVDNRVQEKNCCICMKKCSNYCCLDYCYQTKRKLVDLELLEPLVGQVLTSLIYTHIETYIYKTCKDNFDMSYCINNLETVSNKETFSRLGLGMVMLQFTYPRHVHTPIFYVFYVISLASNQCALVRLPF